MQMWIRSQQWRNCDGRLFLDSFGRRQSRVLMGLEMGQYQVCDLGRQWNIRSSDATRRAPLVPVVITGE